ncbi:MAG: YHS domain protein [Alphaproteobacteria bacterium HGW-Alphaproteobacteria-1]|nr:MAG: YHS domain protein [Alphaproteobacteria bacterium HGW-Alphaproteobacteria-1]
MPVKIGRRQVLVAAGGLALGGAAFAGLRLWSARLEELATAPVFSTDGVAIRGTDPVAYFTERRPEAGDPAHVHDWRGAVWHFATAENRDRFAVEPERYAPQYGGFCAWAVAEKGKLYSTQPGNWSIVDGKLYLNFNDDIQARWETDIPGFIMAGDRRWPEILTARG